MRAQPQGSPWTGDRLLRGIRAVINDQNFSDVRKRITIRKMEKLHKKGLLDPSQLSHEWLYRLCCAGLMERDYHWYAWEWRNPWATNLATKQWVYPRWQGQKHSLLVIAEQGIGDEIVFGSCYHELAEDVEEAWIEVDSRLIPICSRSFPENLHFVSRFMNDDRRIVPRMSDYPGFHEQHGRRIDSFIMAGNVPKLYRHEIKDFPRDRYGWLKADPEKQQRWSEWLSQNEIRMPRTGTSWSGRQGLIKPVLGGVSLQYGISAPDGVIEPPINLKWDIEEVFGLISALDRVVTTTNAVAHRAGALGVPTDVIMPPPIFATAEDGFNNRISSWWPVTRNDWYPSIVMYRSQHEWDQQNRRVNLCLTG